MSTLATSLSPAELQKAARDHLWLHFTRMSSFKEGEELPIIVRGDGCYLEDIERQALSRRARRPVRRQHRVRLRGRDRRGRGRAAPRAPLLHELELRAPARDRAGRRGRLRGARRPEQGVLRLRRLRGGRVGLEARTAVPRGPRRAPVEGDRAAHRLPRDDDGRALDQRHRLAQDAVRAARPGRPSRPQHEPLPPSSGGDRGRVHGLPAR